MGIIKRGALFGKFENLIPLIEELDKDWIPDWTNDKEEKYFIILMHDVNVCFISADRTNQRVGQLYMQESTAIFIKDKINAKLVKQIKTPNETIILDKDKQ